MFKHRFQSLILKGKCSFSKRTIAKSLHLNVRSINNKSLFGEMQAQTQILKVPRFGFTDSNKKNQQPNKEENSEPKQDNKTNEEDTENNTNKEQENQTNDEETKSKYLTYI